MRDALVIIPTYNERDNVEAIADAVLASTPRCEVLVVDDGSPDGTGEIADRLQAENERAHVLHRKAKEGLGRAYIAGFQWALERDFQFILEMDADFSHPPADVRRLIEAAENADLVLGSRYIEGIRVINWPLHRLILSRGAAMYVRFITGMIFTDPTGGFKCFRRAVLETIPLEQVRSNGYSFQIEMTHLAWQLGFAVREIPIVFDERRSGDSKMNSAIVREALWMVWKIWFNARLRRKPGTRHRQSVLAQGDQRS
jgi:dolichol-phosphate mannosyltransferase